MILHEGERYNDNANLPAITLDKEVVQGIKRYVNYFLEDQFCIQILDGDNASIYERRIMALRGFDTIIREKTYPLIMTLDADILINGISTKIVPFGTIEDTVRIARLTLRNHKHESGLINMFNENLFENVDAIARWYDAFKQGKSNANLEQYSVFQNKYNLIEPVKNS